MLILDQIIRYKDGNAVKFGNNEVFYSFDTWKEFERLNKNWNINLNELIEKYFIFDDSLRQQAREICICNCDAMGRISEREINPLGLTPRHIQITFGNEFKVICGDKFLKVV